MPSQRSPLQDQLRFLWNHTRRNYVPIAVLLIGLTPLQLGSAAAQLRPDDARIGSSPPVMAGSLPSLDGNGGWTFRRQVNEVTVMFTATRKGKFVPNLQRQDVQVRDDKKAPAEVMDFRNEQDLPLRLGLLVDTSGSVSDRFSFELQAAGEFLKEVVNQPADRGFVAGFSHQMRVLQDFTSQPTQMSQGLVSLYDDQGDTAMFDAIARACKKLVETGDQQPVARVLVLLSDGDDNASGHTLKDAAELAQAYGVTIYAISTDSDGLDPTSDEVLKNLAEESGGRALFPRKKQVRKAFARIRDELCNRYAVSYRPAEFKPDGHFRRISIVARRAGKKLHVHTRKGYYAKPLIADMISPPKKP